MSTVIYQGRNSYVESRFNDNRTLLLKLSSQKPNNNQDSLNNKAAPDQFVQCKTSSPNPNFDTPYVHPSVKKSMFCLSEKSLSMCTENLGNESGTDVAGFNMSFSCSNSEVQIPSSSSSGKDDRLKKICPSRSMKRTAKDFPPPLTTRPGEGSGSFHIIPRREDGKLILQAVRTSSSTCLRAERSNGCLRLYMLKNQSSCCCDSESKQEDEDEVKNSTERADRQHNSSNGGKLDPGKFQRSYMCKEVGCRKEEILLNLESFWVATS